MNTVCLADGENLYITGNTNELGLWSTDIKRMYGPFYSADNGEMILTAAFPKGKEVEFKLVKVLYNGAIVWENGKNRIYKAFNHGNNEINLEFK